MDNQQIDRQITNAVQLVSKSQTFQKKLFMFLCLMWTQIAFNSLINSMVFTNPLFSCTSSDGIQTYSNENYACVNMDTCKYENSFTATFSAGLYCSNRYKRMMIQSVFAIGCIIGMLVMPIICDIQGRKLTTNLTIFLLLLGNLILFCGQFLCAFGSAAMTGLSYPLSSDFFSNERRQRAIIMFCLFWGFTDMGAMVVWYILPNWWFFMICLLILPTASLYLYFRLFFIQSIHFVVNVLSDFNEAHSLIDKLSVINGANSEDTGKAHDILRQVQGIRGSMSRPTSTRLTQMQKQTLQTILKSAKYFKAIVCLGLIKMGYYSFYYGIQGSLERTGFNFGISIFLLGFGEVTGYAIGVKYVPLFKRKTVAVTSNLLIAFLGFLCLTQTVGSSPFLSSIVLYVSFVFSSFSFSATSLLESQSFSSSIRSSAVGMIFGSSYLIRLGIPFAIGSLNEAGFPALVASAFMIIVFGVLPFFVLKQTFEQSQLQQELVDKQLTFGNEIQMKPYKMSKLDQY